MRQVLGAALSPLLPKSANKKEKSTFPIHSSKCCPCKASEGSGSLVEGPQRCGFSECVRKGRSTCPSAILSEKSPKILTSPQSRAVAEPPPRHPPGREGGRVKTQLRSGPPGSHQPSLGLLAGGAGSRLAPPSAGHDWPRAAGAGAAPDRRRLGQTERTSGKGSRPNRQLPARQVLRVGPKRAVRDTTQRRSRETPRGPRLACSRRCHPPPQVGQRSPQRLRRLHLQLFGLRLLLSSCHLCAPTLLWFYSPPLPYTL